MDEGYSMQLDFSPESESADSKSLHSEDYWEVPSEKNLIPKNWNILGLDISVNSTGVTQYLEGVKFQTNISVKTGNSSPYQEVLLRRQLKSKLFPLVRDKNFDLIIIEDAYQGINPVDTRTLYALNTAIDELIIDGATDCKEFIRVNNKAWKSWLYSVDTMGITKGYKDKEKIQMCMSMLGVEDSGEGFQDRLDSNGMILGYFLHNGIQDKKKSFNKVPFSDLEFAYVLETGDLLFEFPQTENRKRHFVDEARWTKAKVLSAIAEYPDCVIISSSPVKLSLAMEDATGCTSFMQEGGYFAFWVKKSKLFKYLKEE